MEHHCSIDSAKLDIRQAFGADSNQCVRPGTGDARIPDTVSRVSTGNASIPHTSSGIATGNARTGSARTANARSTRANSRITDSRSRITDSRPHVTQQLGANPLRKDQVSR